MRSETKEERLSDYLMGGLLLNMFETEAAYLLAKKIGEYAREIRKSEYGNLFGLWQTMCSNEQTLAAAKMFDGANATYRTRSLPNALIHLEKYASDWKIPNRTVIHDLLVEVHPLSELEGMNSIELTMALVQYFRDAVKQEPLCSALARLKESRDKVIAHNEAVQPSARTYPLWGDAGIAVAHARKFVLVVGEGYLEFTGLNVHLDHPLDWGIPVELLIQRLGLAKTETNTGSPEG